MCSIVAQHILASISPTLNFEMETILGFPLIEPSYNFKKKLVKNTELILKISRADWDAYESSWDFSTLPLLQSDYRGKTLEDSYDILREYWQGMTDEMQRLEEENNRIFIDAYGLEDELTPEVPLKEITLTCNPHYRYSRAKDWTADDYEEALWEDTIKEFLSYAVGCMFGRYSLDAPGLILANQGETLQDYLARVPEPTFMPDDDNVIPILDGDWFSDDITQRFRDFLRVTFGEEHFVENLEFIEEALGKDIRKYFLKDFYADHVKRYKKRPIYWQFSSPKGYFNALIYMHRYRSDTVSIVLNDYLRDFKAKLQAHIKSLEAVTIDPSTSDREKTKAGKGIDTARKALHDIETYESEILFPLAEQQIEIYLDDGVKQNYPKFGKALKKVTGLSAK
jgi:type II restriction/modification system DNA methylase subunit YeeA